MSERSAVGAGRLYLVPMPLGDMPPAEVLPPATLSVIASLTHFIAENARSARRFLVQVPLAAPVQQLVIAELNEHTATGDVPSLLDPVVRGHSVGILSEAGCPVIADPGAPLVRLAHERGIEVKPLVGPTAPILALMASGLSGQAFHFLGYLPQNEEARRRAIQRAERASGEARAAQVFIETPYRNAALFDALLATCEGSTLLTLAMDLTLAKETVVTRSIDNWRNAPRPDLDRRPAVFVLGRPVPLSAPARPRRRP